MSPHDLADDLAYVRTIAEEGRQAPLLGGSFLSFWGVLNAVAWALQWGLVTGRLMPDPDWEFAILWAIYGTIAGVGMSLLGGRIRHLPGRSSVGNLVEALAWMSVGIGIGAIAAGAIGRMILTGDTLSVDVIPPAAFALYGAALLTTAMVSQQVWLRGFAVMAFITATILGVYLHADWFYLAGSAASLAVLLVPGLILLRKEPSTTV